MPGAISTQYGQCPKLRGSVKVVGHVQRDNYGNIMKDPDARPLHDCFAHLFGH